MQPFINIADLKDPDDPQGRSYRQVNAEKKHNIPLGALVEIQGSRGFEKNGVRLFVVHHGRDCDSTPLYYLCDDPEDREIEREGFMNRRWSGGFAESSLKVIKLPE